VQNLFERANPARAESRSLVESFLLPAARRLSIERFGCRVAQSGLRHISREHQEAFVTQLAAQCAAPTEGSGSDSRVVGVPVRDAHASHVLQYVLQLGLPASRVAFIADEIKGDLFGASVHVVGCRVVQCLVKAYPEVLLEDTCRLLADHSRRFMTLSMHQYGNYVVQCMAEKMPTFRERFIDRLFRAGNVAKVGAQKHGSNVIESCIRLASDEERARLVHLLQVKRCALLRKLSSDRFGNYVVGTLLDCCGAAQRRKLVNALQTRVVDQGQRVHGNIMAKCKEIRTRR